VIDVVDLGAGTPAQQALQIDAALRGSGFFAVTGHGVPAATLQAGFDASRRFFALPDADKSRWHIDRGPLRRGWDPVGWQALDPAQPPDLKESFYLGEAAFGPNPWPDSMLVAGFRDACQAYASAMQALARRLMGLFEIALAVPVGHFDAFMRQPFCTLRLLHYPPQPAQPAPGQIGCGAHTDWGALTLLAQDAAGGLQVQPRGGSWLDVPPVRDALVVNIGDLMQRWTNDRWPSTLHRVVNRHHGRERWSIAYFFDLDTDAVIVPLASCVSREQPARYPPLTAGAHLEAMYRATTVATTAVAA
jgi:isopenicillin N synthase-like dioxygenase